MATTIATTQHSFLLFIGGRFLLGLGVESLGVAQSSLTCQWFSSSRRLGMALSLNVIMARMGAIINDVTSPLLWHQWENPSYHWMKQLLQWLTKHGIPECALNGVTITATIGAILCFSGLVATIIVVLVDHWSERRSIRNPEISLIVTSEESQSTRTNGRNLSVDEQLLLLNHHRSTIYGTTDWNGSGSSLNIPTTSNLSQPMPHPHIPFSSVRRQVSARDIRSIRQSYFRTDRLRRISGVYRRYSRPPIVGSRPRQRNSVDLVWATPVTAHGSSTPPAYSPNVDETHRQHTHSDTDHERLTTSADAIISYSVSDHNRSNSNITTSSRRHWVNGPLSDAKKRITHRPHSHETNNNNVNHANRQNHSCDISLATINTTISTSVTTFSYTWSFSLLCFSMIW
jgi:hypothetical protein